MCHLFPPEILISKLKSVTIFSPFWFWCSKVPFTVPLCFLQVLQCSMDAISEWLGKLSMTLFTLDTSDPREGESCSEVCPCSDPSPGPWPACPHPGLLTWSGHTVSGGQGRSGGISQSGASWPRSLNQKRATLCCNNWGR